MTRRALILDLDDTIVDTSSLSALRDRREWKRCVEGIKGTTCFDDISQMVHDVRALGVKIGVVTASVSFYAEKVLLFHGIEADSLIAYHDCSPRKPHPAPINLCLSRLGCDGNGSLGLGDAAKDAAAYKGAGLISYGAGWSPALDRSAEWDRIIEQPDEVTAFFK